MNRKLCARIASVLLSLHGSFELVGPLFVNSMPNSLISFGGLTGSTLEQNASVIAMFGWLWGLARLIAAVGSWSLRKWGILLGIILSTVTIIAAVMIIPAGVGDTFLALPALMLLLYTWFGNEVKEVTGG